MHSLSYSLGGINPKLHHGTFERKALPAALRFNAQAGNIVQEKVCSAWPRAMGMEFGKDASAAEVAAQLAKLVQLRNEELGMPKGLAQMGVQEKDFGLIIERALVDHCHATNPIHATPVQYRQMLEESM